MDHQLELLIHLRNPWLRKPNTFDEEVKTILPDTYVPRLLLETRDWPIRNKAHLLVGARQVGKSTFLWHLFSEKKIPPLYLNAEETLFRDWCRSASFFQQDIDGLISPQTPLFIEEAQNLSDAGLFIKGLIDLRIKNPIYVTGSSSFHLLAKTRESLAGRAVRAILFPLCLSELKNQYVGAPPKIQLFEAKQIAMRHLIYGGYPEVWLGKNPQGALLNLVQAFVMRDASDLFKVSNIDAFRRLLTLLAGQVGGLVNISEWANALGIHRQTVMSYLDILVENHIVFFVRPFLGSTKAEVVRTPKIFFCDNGLRNLLMGSFAELDTRTDKGNLIENWVASELHRQCPSFLSLHPPQFWRTKGGAEVDFVIDLPSGPIGIEVKSGNMKTPELSRSAHNFIELYKPNRFYVVNGTLEHVKKNGSTEICWIPFHLIDTIIVSM